MTTLAIVVAAEGWVTPEALTEAQRESRAQGVSLARTLDRRGLLSDARLADLLARRFALPRADVGAVEPDALALVSAKVATHYHVLPLRREGDALRLAVADPTDLARWDELRVVLKREIAPAVAGDREIEEALKARYGIAAATLEKLVGDAPNAPVVETSDVNDLAAAQDASVVKLVNQILLEAVARRATDIHWEPYADDLRVRYRIDGVLYEAKVSDSLKRLQSAVLSRLKIMANLSIAERRRPQDGRIQARVDGRDMDLRVSTLPTPFGESVGIRLLTGREWLDLPQLGFAEDDLGRLSAFLKRPHGILFLTGPTGSGKTTTLYAFLSRLNTPDRKIITLEDPIEYQLRGITQVQVRPAVDLTFAAGLRSMLRHDPDVMMVGEVRDLETAEIAIRVALTGHLVFSTLHTNDAAGAVTRLLDIGLEPYLVASSTLGFIGQRLVRTVCAACARDVALTDEDAAEFRLTAEEARRPVRRGAGCELCAGTGYRGRTVIYEILPVTPEVRAAVMRREPANLIRELAVRQGMRPLRRCGWEKVAAGVTTPSEVLRVTIGDDL